MKVVSRESCLKHYKWGSNCNAWSLVDEPSLSVKLETMPPGAAEQKHFHRYAQQFFFIIKGEAKFELDNEIVIVKSNQGIHIKPNKKHRIYNAGNTVLEFLLASEPSTRDDRQAGD